MTADVLIIAGMHRSGTSLTAACFQAAGVDMGRHLLPADTFNPRGYYEDTGFLALQRAMLRSACPPDAGHPDWGWAEQGTVETTGLDGAFAGRAAALITERDRRSTRWGWKDPRTTLLLDFWLEWVPHARFAFVFRAPWEVEQSIVRLCSRSVADRPHKHRYFAEHGAELIADLSRIRLLCDESRRVREGYVRSLEEDRARCLEDQQRQAAQLADLESARRGWAVDREALAARCLRAEGYARSLEAELAEARRQRAEAEAYARSLQASRAELEAYARSLESARREPVRRTA